MKILMVGGSPFTTFTSLGVSLLSALAKQKGHEFKYFDLCRYNFDVTDERSLGESLLEFKQVSNPERMPEQKKKPKEALAGDFKDLAEIYNPDLIGLSATSVDSCFGKALLSEFKKDFDMPVIVGGVYATVDPESVIAESWVDMINIGQGEESFIELIDSFDNNKFDMSIKNIWFKKDGEIIRNEIRPALKEFDWLPYPDWSIFDDYHFYRPFLGKLYRHGAIEISRGCPMSCNFCINSYLPKVYGANTYCTKSVERAISEIEFLVKEYNLEFLRFFGRDFSS